MLTYLHTTYIHTYVQYSKYVASCNILTVLYLLHMLDESERKWHILACCCCLVSHSLFWTGFDTMSDCLLESKSPLMHAKRLCADKYIGYVSHLDNDSWRFLPCLFVESVSRSIVLTSLGNMLLLSLGCSLCV